jgi:hypothetical protein
MINDVMKLLFFLLEVALGPLPIYFLLKNFVRVGWFDQKLDINKNTQFRLMYKDLVIQEMFNAWYVSSSVIFLFIHLQ